MTTESRDRTTDLGLLLLAAIWGINFAVVKIVLEEIDPLGLNALRFPLAALVLTLLLRGRGAPLVPARADVPRVVLLGLLGNVVYQLCFIYGLDLTRAGNASLLLATTPIWTMILSAAAGHERPSAGVSLGIVGTLVGMSMVVLGSEAEVSLDSATLRGDVLMIVASILWSIYSVAGRRPIARYGPLRITTWALWVGTPALVAMGIPSLSRTDLGTVSATSWAGVVYAGLLSIGLAYYLWYRGVQKLGNNRTAIYSNLVPVAALVTAWLWLGEVPTGVQLVGATIILMGLTTARLTHSPDPSSPRWRISGNS